MQQHLTWCSGANKKALFFRQSCVIDLVYGKATYYVNLISFSHFKNTIVLLLNYCFISNCGHFCFKEKSSEKLFTANLLYNKISTKSYIEHYLFFLLSAIVLSFHCLPTGLSYFSQQNATTLGWNETIKYGKRTLFPY